MGQVIILEGPDGGGKTTLARELELLKYRYVHCGVPKPKQDLFDFYTKVVLAAISVKQDTVIDRCYLGEGIYGPVMRGADRLGERGRTLLQRLCRAHGVVEVICLPDYATVELNWRAKKSDYVKSTFQLTELYERYGDLATDPYYRWYDYTSQHALSVPWLAVIKPALPHLPPGCLGSPNAKYLLVGERVNARRQPLDLPFYALDGSSGYLNDRLREAGLEERDLAFTNAVKANGQRQSLQVVANALPRLEKVIALGEVAEKACRAQRFKPTELAALPHPAYWSRFHSKQPGVYVKLLQEAVSASASERLLRCVVSAT
jgi:uracil-DNA glycosylase